MLLIISVTNTVGTPIPEAMVEGGTNMAIALCTRPYPFGNQNRGWLVRKTFHTLLMVDRVLNPVHGGVVGLRGLLATVGRSNETRGQGYNQLSVSRQLLFLSHQLKDHHNGTALRNTTLAI
jgi:hypothetical protein